ncbi:MAG: hypothetical protein RLZZ214_465 [Verrucomicrobiota bacterium]|jgi:hypothetical protein
MVDREKGKLRDYMQQQEARLSVTRAAAMRVVSRKNISAMLGMTGDLAIKKTERVSGLKCLRYRLFSHGWFLRGSGEGENLFHNPTRIWKLFMLNMW